MLKIAIIKNNAFNSGFSMKFFSLLNVFRIVSKQTWKNKVTAKVGILIQIVYAFEQEKIKNGVSRLKYESKT